MPEANARELASFEYWSLDTKLYWIETSIRQNYNKSFNRVICSGKVRRIRFNLDLSDDVVEYNFYGDRYVPESQTFQTRELAEAELERTGRTVWKEKHA